MSMSSPDGMDFGAGQSGLSSYDTSSGSTADDEKNKQLQGQDPSSINAMYGANPNFWNLGSDQQLAQYWYGLNQIPLNYSQVDQYAGEQGGEGAGSDVRAAQQMSNTQAEVARNSAFEKTLSQKDLDNYRALSSQHNDNLNHSMNNQGLLSLALMAAGGAYGAYGGGASGGTSASTAGGTAGATWNPALIDSYLGTTGYGASSASALSGAAPAWSASDWSNADWNLPNDTSGMENFGSSNANYEFTPDATTGGDEFVRSSADRAAQYGNTGYGQTNPSFWQNVQTGATKGAVTNGGITAARGGDAKDILKGAAYGAVGGAIGGGIGSYNPAGQMGVTNPYAASAVNSGITGGVNAGLSGGNVGQGILGGVTSSGANSAYNIAGNEIGDYFKNSGGAMPDYGMPDTGTLGGNMYDQNGENSATLGGDFTQAQQQANLGTSGYVPMDTSSNAGPTMKAASSGGGGDNMGLGGFISGLTSNGGLGQIATGLNAAYMAYNARKRANGALDNINGLYSPNSAYAQQMQQTLARKDAAGGRNSQYGTRATELAAALTQAHSNALTSPGYQNMLLQQQRASQQLPITLASMAQSKWGQGAMNSAGDYLQRLYQNYSQPQPTAQQNYDWAPGD